MAELFFDKLMGMLGVDTTPQEDQRDPLDTSDPQFGYRDYTPAERAQEVVTGSLDTAGSMLRGMGKAAIEAPRDIYALGSAIGKIQDRSRNRPDVGPVKTIGQLFTEAYNEAPSFLPDEATAERILPEMTPMSRTYSQDSSVYNLPEEFGRIAAPLPLLDYARPSQIARIGKTPRILEDGLLTDEAVSALGRIPAGMSVKPVNEPQLTTVYHSTDQEFDQFQNRDIGFHTAATPDLAKRATDLLGRQDAKQIPYQIDTSKYVEVSGQSGQWDAEDLANDLAERGVISRETADNIINKAYDIEENIDELVPYWDMQDLKNLQGQMVADELKPFGIEGFKYMNEYDVYGDALRFKGHPEFERMAAEMKAQGIEPDWSYITLDPKGLQRADAPKPTPRILDARDPITGRTGFTSSGSQVPALEPLREPTRQGRFRTQYEDTNIQINPQFAEQQLAKTDAELMDELRNRINHASLVGDLQDKYFQEAPRNLPDGTHIAPSVRMQWAYNQAEQELLRKHKAELRDRLIMPSQERMSFTAQRPSYTAEEGRQILLDEAQRKYQNWKTTGQEMRDRGQQQVASFDLPKLIDRINNASDEQIFATIKAEGLEPKKSPTPRILQEDAPKVEKLPPMLREPAQQARIFNEDGGTGTYSRVEQALLDIKNDPNVPASVTPRSLMQRLEAMGVTKADIEEHGLNLDSITRKNRHGHDVVDIQRVFDEVEPPQDRMSRVILDETGGGDADEMDLSGRQRRGELNIGDFWENEGNYRMDDWLYDYMGDIENDYNRLGRELSPNTFDQQGSQTDEILEAIADRLKMTSEAKTDEEAVLMAYDKLNAAIDQGGDWLSDLDAELGGGIQSKAEETIAAREIEFYNENPYIDDIIDFAGEEYKIFGNDDVGYSVHHNGTNIISDVYSLDELEVQIQNWAMDRGYFGYGTGEGAMQWAQYLQGDSDYYTPLEEVILTYDPKSGRTFHSSHYGDDVADGYVSHMRTTSRETADGESVYHVDEIQSDLHQEGRQTGYATPENREKLVQANTDYDSAQRSSDQIYADLRDNIDIPDVQAIAVKFDPNRMVRLAQRLEERGIPRAEADEALNHSAKMFILDEIDAAADPLKLLKDESISDPDLMRYAEAVTARKEAYREVKKLEDLASAPSNEYPLKDERWIKAMVRQAMERAVSKGDFAGITFSNPQNQINQWSNRYAKLYNEVYENKLKSILETIGKEYGVKPKKVKLNDPEMQDAGENWYLPLTPEMTNSIQSRGVPLASAVGTTPMILDRINKEREDKTPRILRTA